MGWISVGISVVIAAVSITTGIYQSGQSKQAALTAEKIRAEIAQLTLQILDRIDKKLDDYVRQQSWKDYMEGHAKEHFRIEQELTRLRDGTARGI